MLLFFEHNKYTSYNETSINMCLLSYILLFIMYLQILNEHLTNIIMREKYWSCIIHAKYIFHESIKYTYISALVVKLQFSYSFPHYICSVLFIKLQCSHVFPHYICSALVVKLQLFIQVPHITYVLHWLLNFSFSHVFPHYICSAVIVKLQLFSNKFSTTQYYSNSLYST